MGQLGIYVFFCRGWRQAQNMCAICFIIDGRGCLCVFHVCETSFPRHHCDGGHGLEQHMLDQGHGLDVTGGIAVQCAQVEA